MSRKTTILVQTENLVLRLNKKAGTVVAETPSNSSLIPEASYEEWVRLAKLILEHSQNTPSSR